MLKNSLLWLLVGLSAVACSPMSLPRPWQSSATPTVAQVNSYGVVAARQLVQEHGGLLNAQPVQEYLDAVAGQLAGYPDFRGQTWQLQVVNDPACELLAVPGGTLLVYRGFLAAVSSEAELLAVLGHESAHLARNHLAESAIRQAVFNRPVNVPAPVDEQVIRGQQLAEFIFAWHADLTQENEARALWAAQLGAGGQPDVLTDALCRDGWIARHPQGADAVLPLAAVPQSDATKATFAQMKELIRQLTPGYAVFEQGVAAERQDKLPQAIALYLQAATQAPEQSQIVTGLGLAYLKAGELNSARHHLQRAVQLDGEYYRSRLGLGYLALQQGDLAGAETHLRYSQALLPTVQGSYLLADLYQRQDNWALAEPLFQQVAAADPHGTLGKAARQALKDRPNP